MMKQQYRQWSKTARANTACGTCPMLTMQALAVADFDLCIFAHFFYKVTSIRERQGPNKRKEPVFSSIYVIAVNKGLLHQDVSLSTKTIK